MLRSIFSKPYSRLYIVGDNSGWSVDIDAQDLKNIADKLRVPSRVIRKARLNLPQAVHYTSQFSLLHDIYKSRHRISVDYYHGKPDQQESFRKCFEALSRNHGKISRVRVSNKDMETLIKSSGIEPSKVMRIPIGIDLDVFTPRTLKKRVRTREELGIPNEAVVIGSFQKDGVGWDEGNEPKLIKGPDVFLEVISKLKIQIPNLFVLLSGPSRGYVKNGLEKIGVPYRHKYFKDYREIAGLYDALDLYIITSREEGGPKACLESMAKCVPLVTTAVGQCADLVKHRENAMMTPIDNVEALYKSSMDVLTSESLRKTLVNYGLFTAAENSFEAQLPSWKQYLEKLIDG